MGSPVAGPPPGYGSAVPRKLPAVLKGFLLALILLTAASTAGEFICLGVQGCGYPYNSPFVAPVSRFDDLLDWLPRFASLHTAAFFSEQPPVVYPAPTSMLYGGFRLLGRFALPAYLILAAFVAAASGFLTVHELRRRGVRLRGALGIFAILLATSYPFWFLVYTANLELVVFLLLAAGLWLFCREKPMLAACCFALAGALKWTPFLFFLLLLRRRYWQALLLGIAVAAGVILSSLWGVYPDLTRSWHETQAGANLFLHRDGLHNLSGQLGFDHSLLALIKFFDPFLTAPKLAVLWRVYAPLTALFVLALWFGRVRRRPLSEQVLFLTVCLILLPPVSYDYTLMDLYLPGALLFAEVLRRGSALANRRIKIVAACFAVVLTAQGYLVLANNHRGAQFKSLALVGLLAVSVTGLKQRDVSELHSHFLQPEPPPHVL